MLDQAVSPVLPLKVSLALGLLGHGIGLGLGWLRLRDHKGDLFAADAEGARDLDAAFAYAVTVVYSKDNVGGEERCPTVARRLNRVTPRQDCVQHGFNGNNWPMPIGLPLRRLGGERGET